MPFPTPSASQPITERSVLWLAWPLILSFWMRQLFTFVDTYFAARIGDHAVAGIGLAYPLEFLLIAFWVGTSTGMTSLLSRALGAHEGERAAQIVRVTNRIVLVLVPVFVIIGALIWLRPAWFVGGEVDDAVLEQFRIYGSVIVAGTALTGFWSIIPDSIVKAHHDTKATMWAGIWSNMLNITLNFIFVFGLHWGMFGIAFSTVIGRLGGLVYALRKAAVHERRRLAAGLDTAPGTYADPLRPFLALAVPAALTYVLMATESGLVNWVLLGSSSPTESLAAYSIYYRFLMFFAMPVIACGVALLPYTARAWGRRDVPTIRRAFRDVTLAAATYVLVIVTPVVLLARHALIAPLAHSPATRGLAEWALLMVPLACLVTIPFFACRPIFEGLQRGRPGLVMAFVRYAVLTAPLAWLGTRVAAASGWPEMQGVVLGLIAVSAIVSAAYVMWMRALLAKAEAQLQLQEVPVVSGA